MAIAQLSEHYKKLTCPRCNSPLVLTDSAPCCSSADCEYAARPFPLILGKPALIDFKNSVVSSEELLATSGAPQVNRASAKSLIGRRLSRLGHPRNRQANRYVTRMVSLLTNSDSDYTRPVILIIGGGARGSGLDELYAAPGVDILAFDIYWSPDAQFMADCHSIPLASQTVDGVIIQAVLEHVLEPQAVVKEIHRVLRPFGLVYADTPFLQQVHEGPYDFTRYTDSGHRYLLRDFDRIDSGIVAGAGTQLMWSVDYFIRALLRSKRAGLIARFAFSWLAHFDRILDPKYSIDSASSVYFFGRRADNHIDARQIINYYQGAQ